MVRIVPANLANRKHTDGVVAILNSYAETPLTATVCQRLADGLRQHPTTHALLAVDENENLVGAAVCFLGFSTFKAKPLLNLHDLAVLPDHQGQGIGRALLSAVEKLATELGCCKVTLEVGESNPRAQALYYRCGYEDFNGRTYFLEKRL